MAITEYRELAESLPSSRERLRAHAAVAADRSSTSRASAR